MGSCHRMIVVRRELEGCQAHQTGYFLWFSQNVPLALWLPRLAAPRWELFWSLTPVHSCYNVKHEIKHGNLVIKEYSTPVYVSRSMCSWRLSFKHEIKHSNLVFNTEQSSPENVLHSMSCVAEWLTLSLSLDMPYHAADAQWCRPCLPYNMCGPEKNPIVTLLHSQTCTISTS